MMWWWAGLAAAGPYANLDADILVKAEVNAPPSAVYATLMDLSAYAASIPETCADDLVPAGEGAWNGTWHLGLLHPKVRVTIASSEADRRVDVDHDGTRGWVTRFRLAESPTGTAIEAQTYLDLPPRLVRRNYFTKVKPDWEACHAELLRGIGLAAAAR